MLSLQRSLPDSNEDTTQPPDVPMRRSVSPDDLSRVPGRSPEVGPRHETLPASSVVLPGLTPQAEKDHHVLSQTKREPVSPSPIPTRSQQQYKPLHPKQLISASTRPSTVSTATVTEYQASPEFVLPKSLPPDPSHLHHGNEFANLGDVASTSREETMSSSNEHRTARKSVSRRRDPYSHLSTLQRDIILTIQNAQSMLSTTGDAWRGASITMLVQPIARRHYGLKEHDLE